MEEKWKAVRRTKKREDDHKGEGRQQERHRYPGCVLRGIMLIMQDTSTRQGDLCNMRRGEKKGEEARRGKREERRQRGEEIRKERKLGRETQEEGRQK